MKTRTRVLSVIMTLAMILTSLIIVVPVNAAEPTDVWTDFASEGLTGSGAKDAPFLIKSAADLAYVAKMVNATSGANNTYRFAHYKIDDSVTSLDMSAYQWVPIGYLYQEATYDFRGVFNGNNKPITGIKLTNFSNAVYTSSTAVGGLFGRCHGATLENINISVTVTDPKLPGATSGNFGGIAGAFFTSSMTNCHVNLTLTATKATRSFQIGGLVGYTNGGATFTECSVSGSINVTTTPTWDATNKAWVNTGSYSQWIGGLIGRSNNETKLIRCVNNADITLLAGVREMRVGGLVAYMQNDGATNKLSVNNCVNNGDIFLDGYSDDDTSSSKIGAYVNCGGVVGYATNKGTIEINGFVNLGEMRYNITANSAVGAVIGLNANAQAGNTLANVAAIDNGLYTIGNNSAATTFNGVPCAKGAANVAGHEHLGLYYTTGDSSTVVSLNKGAVDAIVAAGGTVTVTRGSTSTTYNVANAQAGTYEYTVAVKSGALSFKVTGLGSDRTVQNLWRYYADVAYAGGAGTDASPYQIATAEQLALLSLQNYNHSNGGAAMTQRFKLTADVDIGGREWTPIANYGYNPFAHKQESKTMSFQGKFDGDGYTIKNLTLTTLTGAAAPSALFGSIGGSGCVHDFYITGTITKSCSSVDNYAPAMVTSFIHGGSEDNALRVDSNGDPIYQVKNVTATGTIKVTITEGEQAAGGIVGNLNNGGIKGCVMNGSVTVTGNGKLPLAGGIVGISNNNTGAFIIGCVNNAAVRVVANGTNSIVGGIISKSMNNTGCLTILGCINNGDISVGKVTNGESPDNQRLGGIIGNLGRFRGTCPVTIEGCLNTGKVAIDSDLDNGLAYVNPDTGVAEPSSSSGAGQFVGHMEGKGVHVINNLLTLPYSADTKNVYHIGTATACNGGATAAGKNKLVPNFTSYFEVDVNVSGTTATINVTKNALDAYLAGEYAMSLVYGDKTFTDISEATVNGDMYTWTTTAVEGAEPTLTMTTGVKSSVKYVADPGTWAGLYAADSFAGGTGSSADPYQITTAAELGLLASLVNDWTTHGSYATKHYDILADIDLGSAEWMPMNVTHNNMTFQAILDGQKANGENAVISNLMLTKDAYAYTKSFIGMANGTFAVKNLNFESPVIGDGDVGKGDNPNGVFASAVVVGNMYAGTIDNVHVTNMTMDAHNRSNVYMGAFTGCLANNDSVISNSSADGEIKWNAWNFTVVAGGLVGRARMGKIQNCVSTVNIDIDATFNPDKAHNSVATLGGIAGLVGCNTTGDKVYIDGCVNKGNIRIDVVENTGNYIFVGGIAGAEMTSATDGFLEISGCINTGNLAIGDADLNTFAIGGILGAHSYSVTKITDSTSLTTDNIIGTTYTYKATANTVDLTSDYAIDIDLTTKDKAAVRIDKDDYSNSGLRFKSTFTTADYDALVAKYGKGNVTFGTIIAPTVYFDAFEANRLPDMLKIPYELAEYVAADFGTNGFFAQDATTSTFTGAVTNVMEQNMSLDFTAVAYVEISIGGETYTIYSDYNGEDERARNMMEVAWTAYNDRSETKTGNYICNIGDGNENGNWSQYSKKQLEAIYNMYNLSGYVPA